ncbi:Multidrug/Oligosaccharidyl-lipid/Polysaccharide (MOP) Flippase Superfamily [Achlya hypogyna]|uniref:Multidrug/Oligosaccharidyl-lipid/Polysaccharide (MOP) Flippase Superfamily n=1 Tax=Achlya hypogyna TaxID=1202772 RepID=A0A1V9ZTZ0_ACHHY|nr:Multidrug/Oligosaccharidyl-lipid/Polysaccharide (MOP) Flippase Superfamily [Achlya hypogyna]
MDNGRATTDAFILRKELLPFIGFALQLVVSNVARLAVMVIDSAFIGHVGTDELAGAALATLWIQFPLYIVWAMASALIALCGQAYGAKSYKLMGVWLQMALILITVCSAPVMLYNCFIEGILRHATDDESVVKFGARFSLLLTPIIWPLLAYVCLRQYLQAMGIVMPTTINGIAAIGIDVAANYLLIYTAGLGFDGSPLATVIAAWFQPIALFLYAIVYKQYHKQAWGGWKMAELTWARWKTFLRMAIPLALNDGCNILAEAVLSFVVAKMGAEVIAVNAIMSSVWAIVGAMFTGVGIAAEVGLAADLGAGRPKTAKSRACLGFVAVAFTALFAVLGLWFGRTGIVGVFTEDARLLDGFVDVLPIFVAALCADAFQLGLVTALQGMGQMGFVTIVTVVGSWGVQLPLAYYFGLYREMGLRGVWTGCAVATTIKLIVLAIKFATINWEKVVAEARSVAEAADGKISNMTSDDDDSEDVVLDSAYIIEAPVHNVSDESWYLYSDRRMHITLI